MTLIEVIVAMAILLIVLGAIVDSFASATKTESDQIARTDAQTNARLALETMRRDIHCATAADTTTVGQLTLTEPGVPCAQSTTVGTVYWCAVSDGAGGYTLRRTITSPCDATSLIKASFLSTNAIWSNTTCVTGRARAVSIDLQVAVKNKTPSNKRYRLQDAIVLRNGASLCP
jgi:type II secretory pathway pseudopilin PulG